MQPRLTTKWVAMVLLMLVLLFTACSPAPVTGANEDTLKLAVAEQVQKALTIGYSELYELSELQLHISSLRVEECQVQADVLVTVNTTLKAKTPGDTPLVSGMLRRLGLPAGYTYQTRAELMTSIAQASPDLQQSQVTAGADLVAFWFNQLQQSYLGKASEMSLVLKASGEVEGWRLASDTLVIMAENVEEFIPLTEMLPESSDDLKQRGFDLMSAALEAAK